MKLQLLVICNIFLLVRALVKKISPLEQTINFWQTNGQEELSKKLREIKNFNKAKNIILFIGDGMGPSTLAVARIYKNQRMINSILPDENLSLESLRQVGVVKTHSVNDYVADSSSTATALLTGVKIRSETVGVGPNVYFNQCETHDPVKDNLESIAKKFYKENKSVGIVTSTRVTHATPSSLYANLASRYWEFEVPKNCKSDDIALQLLKKAEQFQVILGGGLNYFIPKSMNGNRTDGRDLLSEWKEKMKKFKSYLVTNSSELRKIDLSQVDYLFGLLGKSHLKYDPLKGDEPGLDELTEIAIRILSKNKNGYFLLVEGGKIDLAHHNSQAVLAIKETLALDKAISNAIKFINFEETLILVTADHSHVFTVGSYAHREVDITKQNQAYFGYEKDKKGHTSLLYSNGPGYHVPRANITDKTNFTINYVYLSGVPFDLETHGGEDIVVYGDGPWSHLITGHHQQSYIYYVMMYASCTERYKKENHCNMTSKSNIPMKFYWIILNLIVIYLSIEN